MTLLTKQSKGGKRGTLVQIQLDFEKKGGSRIGAYAETSET